VAAVIPAELFRLSGCLEERRRLRRRDASIARAVHQQQRTSVERLHRAQRIDHGADERHERKPRRQIAAGGERDRGDTRFGRGEDHRDVGTYRIAGDGDARIVDRGVSREIRDRAAGFAQGEPPGLDHRHRVAE